MNEHNCTSEYNEKAVSPRQHGQLMTAGSGATTLRAKTAGGSELSDGFFVAGMWF
jgi:hypothetical protein